MSSVAKHIDGLESRGTRLRGLSRTLFLLGISLGFLGWAAIWPDKGADDILDASRLLVPDPLAEIMRKAEFPTGKIHAGEMWPGDQALRIQLGLLPIGILLLWHGLGWFLKNWTGRWILLVFVWPIPFIPIYYVAGMTQQVEAVLAGQVSAQPVPVGPSITGVGRLPALAYHIQPSVMVPELADQARFVLAQQAYRDRKPPEVARQLRAMTGKWQPDDELTKTIVGVLSDYAAARGENVGAPASDIADGRPYQTFRFHFTRWSIRLCALLVLAGFATDVVGIRRQRSARRMRSLMPEALEAIAPLPPSSGSFGSRNAAG